MLKESVDDMNYKFTAFTVFSVNVSLLCAFGRHESA